MFDQAAFEQLDDEARELFLIDTRKLHAERARDRLSFVLHMGFAVLSGWRRTSGSWRTFTWR